MAGWVAPRLLSKSSRDPHVVSSPAAAAAAFVNGPAKLGEVDDARVFSWCDAAPRMRRLASEC